MNFERKKYELLIDIINKNVIIQANACIQHNAYNELDRIKCETLVIGGDSDKVAGKNYSEEIAEKIPASKLSNNRDGSFCLMLEAG